MHTQTTCQSLTSRRDSGSGNVVSPSSLCDILDSIRRMHHISKSFTNPSKLSYPKVKLLFQ
ncbi:hypothetical protein EHQ79_00030 [Leptospira jelokensis]|nr:hypothetical protein EHQ79_00030 [Leptospira jelokensis]